MGIDKEFVEELLIDVLDAKEVMREMGIQQDCFRNMFKELVDIAKSQQCN